MSSYFDHFILINFFSFFSDSMMILMIMLFFLFVLNKNIFLIKNKKHSILYSMMSHFKQLVNQNLNSNSMKFTFAFVSVFSFLLFMNFFGYFLFTHPVTTHLSMTLNFAFVLWFGIFVYGVYLHKSKFFSIFMPKGSPLMMSSLLIMIEMVSYISSPIALGMSLAANLTAGHMLLAILSDFSCKLILLEYNMLALFPVLMIIFMAILELGVLVMQAYVFVLLTMVYLSDSLMLH